MSSFLDEADFDAMREAMSLFDEQRDTVVKRNRDITKASKVAICLHRGGMDKADAQIAQALAAADELTVVEANPQLRNSGSYSGGLKEYAEGRRFSRASSGPGRCCPPRNSRGATATSTWGIWTSRVS